MDRDFILELLRLKGSFVPLYSKASFGHDEVFCHLNTENLSFVCEDNSVSLASLPVCYFYFDDKDICFLGNSSIVSEYGYFNRASNGYPVDFEYRFGDCRTVFLLSQGVVDNLDDSFFTCVWKGNPSFVYIDIFSCS